MATQLTWALIAGNLVWQNMISETNLKEIYGTTTDLEQNCFSATSCWQGYENHKPGYIQEPYLPYIGPAYKGIVFSGINLNGGNDRIEAIDTLVDTAKTYLNDQKFRIFRQKGYGGSTFYYYVPLLSFMVNAVLNKNATFQSEDDISWEQIIEGFDYCAITNLIKCSTATPDGRSKPSNAMWQNCIPKFRIELEKIAPKVVFFFSKFLYPTMLEQQFPGFKRRVQTEKCNVSDYKSIKIVEIAHPMGRGTRKARFEEYLQAIEALKKTL